MFTSSRLVLRSVPTAWKTARAAASLLSTPAAHDAPGHDQQQRRRPSCLEHFAISNKTSVSWQNGDRRLRASKQRCFLADRSTGTLSSSCPCSSPFIARTASLFFVVAETCSVEAVHAANARSGLHKPVVRSQHCLLAPFDRPVPMPYSMHQVTLSMRPSWTVFPSSQSAGRSNPPCRLPGATLLFYEFILQQPRLKSPGPAA